jgi:hypothetical protein
MAIGAQGEVYEMKPADRKRDTCGGMQLWRGLGKSNCMEGHTNLVVANRHFA